VGGGTGGAGAAFFNSGAYIPSIGIWGGSGFRNRSFGGVFLGFPLTSYEADEYIPPASTAPASPPNAATPPAPVVPPLAPAAAPPSTLPQASPNAALPPAPAPSEKTAGEPRPLRVSPDHPGQNPLAPLSAGSEPADGRNRLWIET
jgi:hypothetical protein